MEPVWSYGHGASVPPPLKHRAQTLLRAPPQLCRRYRGRKVNLGLGREGKEPWGYWERNEVLRAAC